MSNFLSYSKVKQYFTCSEQWWLSLQYKPLEEPDYFLKGKVCHKAISEFFLHGVDPLQTVTEEYEKLHFTKTKIIDESLVAIDRWKRDLVVARLKPIHVEYTVILDEFRDVSEGFKGIIDFYGELDGQRVIVDWKTSSNDYNKTFVENFDEQSTAYYMLAQRLGWQVDKFGFCVFGRKSFGSKNQWVWFDRNSKQIAEYRNKVAVGGALMKLGTHVKQPEQQKCRLCPVSEPCINGFKNLKTVKYIGEDF